MKKITFLLLILFSFLSFHAASQNADTESQKIDSQLKSGKKTVTDILTNDSLEYLHPETVFRETIKANAKAENITLVSKNEPGIRITIKGRILNKEGVPYKNATIYVYHTSDKGWYAATSVHVNGYEGDYRHARLFGYLKTGGDGAFSFNTIKPKGYPSTDLAAHIHIQVWDENNNLLHCAGELQFEDDPRMTPERRKKSLSEGFLISENSGTQENPVYSFRLTCN